MLVVAKLGEQSEVAEYDSLNLAELSSEDLSLDHPFDNKVEVILQIFGSYFSIIVAANVECWMPERIFGELLPLR